MSGTLTILHAEDDQNDLLFIRRAFERAGLKPIHTSPDGDDALQYLQGLGPYSDRKAHPYPDILITDLKMPKLTGFELLEWIASHPDHRLPVVVVSGSAQQSDIKLAYSLGACCYFVKPTKSTDLAAIALAIESFWKDAQLPRPNC